MMTMNLPKTFCWTKMGAEAGEGLAAIILRKEWERQLGNGYFLWGIGQSLGSNARAAANAQGSLSAIFSPMLSKPKLIDSDPSGVLLWNSWIDSQGQMRRLPLHCFITSRAYLPSGRKKESHYALVCYSDKPLTESKDDICIFPKCLRNLATNKPLGASQVTSVVRFSEVKSQFKDSKGYSVSFATELCSPYCIKLAEPIYLESSESFEICSASTSGDISKWSKLVKKLRSKVQEKIEWRQCTLDFSSSLEYSTVRLASHNPFEYHSR